MRTFAYHTTLAVALAGCAAPPEPSPSGGTRAGAAGAALGMCERYRDTIPLAYERCLVSAARLLPAVEAMNEVCSKAGMLTNDCHYEWVDARRRIGDIAPAVLLAACEPSADCALQILDTYPDPDVIVQMTRCEAADRFRGFCIGHAARRWAATEPDAAEIARVLAAAGDDADVIGPTVGIMVACRGVGACPEDGSLVDVACKRELEVVRAGRAKCLDPTVSSGQIGANPPR